MTGKKIALHGKPFELFLSEKEIASAIGRLAEEINRDFQGKEVVILGVLDGAFMLLADLLKKLEVSLTLELVKFWQAKFIMWDAEIYCPEKDMATRV